MDQRLGFRSVQANANTENASLTSAKSSVLASTLQRTPVAFRDKTNRSSGEQSLKSAVKKSTNVRSSPAAETIKSRQNENNLQFDFDDLDFHQSEDCYCCGGRDESKFGQSSAPTLAFLEQLNDQVVQSVTYNSPIDTDTGFGKISLPAVDAPRKLSPIPEFSHSFKFTAMPSPKFNSHGELLEPAYDQGDSDSSTLLDDSTEADDDALEVPAWDESMLNETYDGKSANFDSSVCGGW